MLRLNLFILALCVAVAAMTAAGCSTSRGHAIESGRELTMFVATDLHYLSPGLNDRGEAFQKYSASGDGRHLDQIDALVDAFARDVRQASPDVLIISGDLTNNGERDSHLELAGKLKRLEEASGTKTYVIPGNHDVENPWARGFKGTLQYKTDSVGRRQFPKIYQAAGYGEAISRDRHTLSYLAAPSEDVWLLMLDTSVYQDNYEIGAPATFGRILPETFKWIGDCARRARESNARIVTVMHHNLLDHTLIMNSGFTLDENEKAIEAFKEYGLSLFLSGHIHIQDIEYRDREDKPIYDIVTSALTVYPVQYGVLQFTPAKGFDYHTSRVDVEGWAKSTGNPDENLRDFQAYSRNRFTDTSYRRNMKRLSGVETLSEPDKRLMAETASQLNAHYFAGTVDAVRSDALQSPGYKLWRNGDEEEFTSAYIHNMLYDDRIENNRLHIPDFWR